MGTTPLNWTKALLEQVILGHQPGFASGKKNVAEGIAHLRMNNIGLNGNLVMDLVRTVPPELLRPQHLLERGDVLVCTTNSAKLVGKCSMFDLEGRYAFSNHLTRLRPNREVILPKFLMWNLWFLWRSGHFEDKCKHWVNQSAIPKENLLAAPIIVPPLPEQRRIVAKLEDLLGEVEACQKRLERIPFILRRFRQSVLAAACSGLLTEDWRRGRQEFGNELVQRLQARHDANGGHQRGNASPPTEGVHDLTGEDMPESWGITDLRNVCEPSRPITYGILKPGPNVAKGVPYVRVADYPNDKLNLETIRKTTKEIEAGYARARLREGDILLSIRGTVGRLCSVPTVLEGGNITQDTARLSIQDAMDARFVAHFLKSPKTQARMRGAMKGVAVHGINIGDVRALQVPVPPLPEQQEIVRRLGALFSLADRIEFRYDDAKASVKRLTQSILAKAFRGELVPQNLEDEPATSLPERLAAQRPGR